MSDENPTNETFTLKFKDFVYEFIVFGLKEAQACIFAASFFFILIFSSKIPLFGLPRYDFIFIAALLLQVILVATKIETLSELFVLSQFHLLGLALEIFKTHPAIGSWVYPEDGFFKILNVPLYSGFMYAAVASYMCQAWRIFRLNLVNYPSYRLSVPLCAAIYLNFFTHHFIGDYRWYLAIAVLITFRKTWVEFYVLEKKRQMPLLLAFFCIGFFVWVAENIATFYGAWVYPEQNKAWTFVSLGKVSSWVLLVIISLILVAALKHTKSKYILKEVT